MRSVPCAMLAMATLFAAQTAAAGVIVADPGAHAEATVVLAATGVPPTQETSTDSRDDPAFASANATNTIGANFGDALAEATTAGPLRSGSNLQVAGGQNVSSTATASASWLSGFTTEGTDPGAPIDVDVQFSVTGTLNYGNNNSGAGFEDIYSLVTAQLAAGGSVLFNGTARLVSLTNVDAPDLELTGDWAGRSGDFTVGPRCDSFFCSYDVNMSFAVEDALLTGFGDVFDVEALLLTEAFAFASFEVFPQADFLGTGDVTLSTDTPGVRFVPTSTGPAPAPAPATLLLLIAGLASLRAVRALRA